MPHHPFPFPDFAEFLSRHLEGKIQKLTVNTALSCPNRDGTKGRGGCIYCNNSAFSPGITAQPFSVSDQLAKGREFFARKYPKMRYLAYFQSYTSTNAPVERLLPMYREALAAPGVAGIVIGTRPDCMPSELLDELCRIKGDGKFVMVEYGAESACDATLEIINRCHTWADTADSVRRTAAVGIPVGLHLINGLPGEDRARILATVDAVNALPVDVVKFHQLQIVRGTRLHQMTERGEIAVKSFTVEEYVNLCCDIIDRLRHDIAIDRFVSQSPDNLLMSPRWGLKNYQFTNLLAARYASRY